MLSVDISQLRVHNRIREGHSRGQYLLGPARKTMHVHYGMAHEFDVHALIHQDDQTLRMDGTGTGLARRRCGDEH